MLTHLLFIAVRTERCTKCRQCAFGASGRDPFHHLTTTATTTAPPPPPRHHRNCTVIIFGTVEVEASRRSRHTRTHTHEIVLQRRLWWESIAAGQQQRHKGRPENENENGKKKQLDGKERRKHSFKSSEWKRCTHTQRPQRRPPPPLSSLSCHYAISRSIVFCFLFHSYFILISIVVLSVQIEDVYRREQVERFNQRLREFEEDQRAYRNHHHGVGVHGVGVGVVGADRPPVETELVDVSLFSLFQCVWLGLFIHSAQLNSTQLNSTQFIACFYLFIYFLIFRLARRWICRLDTPRLTNTPP